MRSRWMAYLSVGVAVAIMALTAVGPALAQTATPSTPDVTAPGTTPAAPGARYNRLLTTLAGALGMSEQDVLTERRAGKSYADIAGEKNVPLQTLTDALIKDRLDAIDQRLANQAITQKQADWLKKAAQSYADLLLTAPFVVNAGGFGFGMGDGMGMGMGMMGPGMMGDDFDGRGRMGPGMMGDDDSDKMPFGRRFDDNNAPFGRRGMGPRGNMPGAPAAPAAPTTPEASPTAPGTSGA